MRVTLINQAFYPDVVSSGQHLADLALRMAGRGHEVTVVTSRRAYDDPEKVFPKEETWHGIRIVRVPATGFGKRAKWRRAADFGTFLWSCCWSLLRLPRQDLVVAMTSPPLISFIGAWFARLRGGRFCYWIMDLNPDEALAAGWLAPGSLAARLSGAMFPVQSASGRNQSSCSTGSWRSAFETKELMPGESSSFLRGRTIRKFGLTPKDGSAFEDCTRWTTSLW